MKRIVASLLPVSLAVTPASAAVDVTRSGSENPMKEIGQSVFYGALTGALVGGAIALADEGGNDSDKIRWGIVAGTFVGLGVGFWHVTSRPRADALLEFDRDATPRLAMPVPEPSRSGGVRVSLLGARF